MAAVGLLGLGLMGGALATHLLADGHEVIGHDPDPDRRAEHRSRGGAVVNGPAAVVERADTVILSLPSSDVVLAVVGELAGSVRPELLVIDTTTGRPEDATEAAAGLAERGWAYVDATISGNRIQARTRDVIFMVGGDPADVDRAREVLEPLGRAVHHVGPVGAGSRAKLVVNHVLSINRVALAEALTVAERAGIDLAPMLEVLRDSAAYSTAMDLWGERMIAGDHWPPTSRIGQNLKDSWLINDHAEAVGASRGLVEVVRRVLEQAEAGGLVDADNSAVIEVMRRRAGIGRHPGG